LLTSAFDGLPHPTTLLLLILGGFAPSDFYQMKDYHFKDAAQAQEAAYCTGASRSVQY
jgi:hypothetical protein